MVIFMAFDGAGIHLKKQIISSKKIPQIRFPFPKPLHNLRNRASHGRHQPRFPSQQLSQAWNSELLQPPPNRSPSDSEPPLRSSDESPPPLFSSSRSSKRLLKFLAVSQPPVPELAWRRGGVEVRHGGFDEFEKRSSE